MLVKSYGDFLGTCKGITLGIWLVEKLCWELAWQGEQVAARTCVALGNYTNTECGYP